MENLSRVPPASPVAPARPARVDVAAVGAALAVLSLLLVAHSLSRSAAFLKAAPPFPEEPPAAAELEASLAAVEAASASAPDLPVLKAREGELRLLKAEQALAAGDREAAKALYGAAASSLEEALRMNPLAPAPHWQMVICLERLGRRAEADAFAERAATKLTAFPRLQFFLGKFFLERRARPDPRDPSARWDEKGLRAGLESFRLAATADLSYLDEALTFIEKTLPDIPEPDRMIPQTRQAGLRYARFLAARGSWAAVARIEEEALEAGGDGPDARLRAGEARLFLGYSEEAQAHFKAAVLGWILSETQVNVLAGIFLRTGRAEEGLKFMLSLDHALDPEEVLPFAFARGRMLFELGRLADAAESFSKAALEGANPEAYYYLALIYEKIDDLFSAETNLRQAMRGRKDQARYHHKLGLIYEKLDRIPDALRELQIATGMEPRQGGYRADFSRVEERWRRGR